MSARRPIILGIVGDSAAGKTTITRGLVDLLGPERVTHLCTDDYHRYDRTERAQLGITALHPDCNYIDVMERDLESLRRGRAILKPVYDHATGSLVRPEYVPAREFVIVEGLLGFSTAALRQLCDIKVYLDPPEELRRCWKIKRDTSKRGYTADQVVAELEKREADSRDYIRPQREHSDIVVRFHPPAGAPASNGRVDARLVLRPTIPHPLLSYLFDGSQGPRSGIRLELGRDGGRPADLLEIDGDVIREHASELEEQIWQHLPDLRPLRSDQFGVYQDKAEMLHSDPLALTQLLLTYHLLRSHGDAGGAPLVSHAAAI